MYKYGWKKDHLDHRDKKLSLRQDILLPTSIDLRQWCPPIWDQGQISDCTAYAITAAYQYDAIKNNQPDATMEPSQLFLYWQERLMEGDTDQDAGAEIRDGMKCLNSTGVCENALWCDPNNLFTAPTQDCYTNAFLHKSIKYQTVNQTLQDIQTTLASNLPVILGISCYSAIQSPEVAQTGDVPMPGPDAPEGGHAILLVSYNNDIQRFGFRNSWGTSWGNQGYGTLPYAYITNEDMCSDLWVLQQVQ